MLELNIKSFEKQIQENKMKHFETFNFILNKCHQKMRLALEKGLPGVYFEIPEFIIGKPVYRLEDCLQFIIFTLTNNGFMIKYYFPKIIYISWKSVINNDIPQPPPKQIVLENNVKPNNNFTKSVKQNKNSKFVLDV
jgi:hypothetical protein